MFLQTTETSESMEIPTELLDLLAQRLNSNILCCLELYRDPTLSLTGDYTPLSKIRPTVLSLSYAPYSLNLPYPSTNGLKRAVVSARRVCVTLRKMEEMALFAWEIAS